ncbi:MAG TPA: lipoprotein-releasing ABC transporter permease subunit, partial [Gammaproteobacteria bacterium]|nr:lipoprotein-releasing ABC transporter permease subunit [Gammaproteobacteria bacterium]
MFRPFALFIGSRYTNLKRRDHFITFISIVSMLGIALGVMVLITVMSVMNGFTKEIRARILSVTPHIIFSQYGQPLQNYETISQALLLEPSVEAVGPYVDGQGMLTRSRQVRGVLIKGVMPESVEAIFPLESTLVDGDINDLKPGEFGVVLGKQLAHQLNLWVGDQITLVIPDLNVSLAGATPRLKRLKIVGIFEIGYIYDNGYAFMHMQDAAKMFKTFDGVSGLQLRLKDPFAAPRIAKDLQKKWGGKYGVIDWTTLNATYFSAVKMEKTMMFFTLILILAVAVFNLISTLVMVVTDKRGDIAILRTLGASRRKIMSIFMYQGLIIGVIGTLIGVLTGVALSLHVTELVSAIERIFSVQFLSADVYFISFLPSD